MAASLGPSLQNPSSRCRLMPLIRYTARVVRANTLALRENALRRSRAKRGGG